MNEGGIKRGAEAFLILMLSTVPLSTLAQDGASRDAELEALKRQVLDLQQRIAVLEQRFGYQGGGAAPADDAVTATLATPGDWRDAGNWDRLHKGQEEYRVARALGDPERSKVVNNFEYWYYGDGKVTLYLGRVKSWQLPSQASD
jgi:hypothetical protein